MLFVVLFTALTVLSSSMGIYAAEDEETDVTAEVNDAGEAEADSGEDETDETGASSKDSDSEVISGESGEGDSQGDEEELPPEDNDLGFTIDNGIPVIYLNIDESQGTIEDMLNSKDHSVFCYGSVTIVVPEGFHYVDFADLDCEGFEDLSMSIRGRGNSTWSEKEKKPFKIKLDKKEDLFGLGKNKHWVLLANVYDNSLLKDRITAWLGDEMNFAFTPRGVPVDVVMTGENYGTQYLGSYYFSENVRVDDNRLDIKELEEDDTDPQVITGGYLLQNSTQVREGSPDKFETSRGAKWATHTPSFDTEENTLFSREAEVEPDSDVEESEDAFVGCELEDAYENSVQQQYIQNQIQRIEDVIYEGGTAYRELVDIESSAKYWLVQTVTKNNDAFATGSTYIYKDRDIGGQLSKLYWGPLWDFDFGYDRNMIASGMDYGHEWMKPMFCDRDEGGFVQEIHKQWPAVRDAMVKITEDGGLIDQYYEETKASAVQDYLLYHQGDAYDYHYYTEHLKTWIKDRIAWLDENFYKVDDLVHQATFIVDGEVYAIEFMAQNEYLYGDEKYPEKEGYTFLGWFDEDGNVISGETALTRDMTLTADYISDSEVTHGQDIVFHKDNDIVEYNSHVFMYQIPYTVIPTDALDKKVEWTSSDEAYATVDDDGMVNYHGPGEVTLTAKLKYGETREYHLTIHEGSVPVPVSVSPDTDVIYMAPGDQTSFNIITDPSPAKINEYIYESEDPGVVTAEEYGILTAVDLGQTQVHITAKTFTDEGQQVLKTSVTVYVTEDGEPPEDEGGDTPEPPEDEGGDTPGGDTEGDPDDEGGQDEGGDTPESPEDEGGDEPGGDTEGDPDDEGGQDEGGDTPGGDTEGDPDDEGGDTPEPPEDEGGNTPEPPETITVPDVLHMTLQAVQTALAENKFTYTIIMEDTNDLTLDGLVLRTDPVIGTSGLPVGTMINVYLGHYVPKKVKVPNVLEKSLTEATALAESTGLKVSVIETKTEKEEQADLVFGQEPASETEADEGSMLVLQVYKYDQPAEQEEPEKVNGSPTKPTIDDYSDHWRERPIPASFDLRNVDTDGDGKGDRCYVPPVRQQNPFGSCWGFAATAAAEISILGSIEDYDPEAYKTINLSEKQLVYFSHTPLDDPDNPQNGEGTIPEDINDANSVYDTGGVPFLAAAAYAQGIGPSQEDKEEYGDLFKYFGKERYTIQHYYDGAYRDYCYSDLDDWSIPEEYRFARDYYLTESYLLPSPARSDVLGLYEYNPEATELIKEQILDKRGVCIGFCADVSKPDQNLEEEGIYLNNKTWSHYTWSDNDIANHAVVIIGWDDNYPKENFLDAHQPPENGAWLVRNSWGSGECEFPDCGERNWGIPVQKKDENGKLMYDENGQPVMVGSGYFWLSYYDRSLINPESFVFSDSIATEYVDQHDYLPISSVTVKESDTPVKMANVFTAKYTEMLTGISCMTASMNTKVSYEIYLLCNDFASPDEGLRAASGTTTFNYGGYHKIDLPEEVCIQRGQSYAIILTMTGEDGSYIRNDAVSIVLEDKLNQNGVINPKESFLYRNGEWEDYREVTAAEISQYTYSSQIGGVKKISDNFPIKGYGNRVTGDVSMFFNISNDHLVMFDGYNTTKVKLYFRGIEEIEIGNPEVQWTFLKGSEEIADLVPQKEGSQILLTAKKTGTVYLAVSLDKAHERGTAVLKLEVFPAVPAMAITPESTNVYTGEPIRPYFIVHTEDGILLTEDVHYTVEYSNNTFCGVAGAKITAILDEPDEEVPEPITASFMIIPPKAEIDEIEGSSHEIYLSFTDYWEIGAEGYEVEYRKEGDDEWIAETVDKGDTEYTIQGLDNDITYEVRVRSYVSGFAPMIDIPMNYYSEYSDTETVTVE